MKSFSFKRFLLLIPRLISPLMTMVERLFINYYSKGELKHQPIFIIGAPRTGSTILYQALTNCYDVIYIDNLIGAFYKNIFIGAWLSKLIYKNRPHNNYQSVHGNTSKFGLHSPNECGAFWYRWLPKTHHYIEHNEICEKSVVEIRKQIAALINKYDKPIVFKNLNAGQRLRLLKKCFPNAKFVFIQRDPIFVLNSILKARKKARVGEGVMWSILPSNFQQLIRLPELEMCANQVFQLEKQIIMDLELFGEKDWCRIHYQNLDNTLVEELGDFLFLEKRKGIILPNFHKDELGKISTPEYQILKSEVKKLNFEKGMFIER